MWKLSYVSGGLKSITLNTFGQKISQPLFVLIFGKIFKWAPTSRSSLSKSMSSTHGLILLKIFRRFPSDFWQIWNFIQKKNIMWRRIFSILSIKAIDYISLVVNSNHLFRLMIIVFFLVIFIISMQQLKTVALITTHTRSVGHFFQKFWKHVTLNALKYFRGLTPLKRCKLCLFLFVKMHGIKVYDPKL